MSYDALTPTALLSFSYIFLSFSLTCPLLLTPSSLFLSKSTLALSLARFLPSVSLSSVFALVLWHSLLFSHTRNHYFILIFLLFSSFLFFFSPTFFFPSVFSLASAYDVKEQSHRFFWLKLWWETLTFTKENEKIQTCTLMNDLHASILKYHHEKRESQQRVCWRSVRIKVRKITKAVEGITETITE